MQPTVTPSPQAIDSPHDARPGVLVDPRAIARLMAALGVAEAALPDAPEASRLLELAAERIDKASRMLEQLGGLRQAAQRSGFTGNSAPLMLKFVSEKLDADLAMSTKGNLNQETGSKTEWSAIASACERLDPELAFHEGHLVADAAVLRNACLRVICESAARIDAQRTTIEVLVSPLAASGSRPAP